MVSKAALSIFILRILCLITSLISVAIVADSHHYHLYNRRYGYQDFVTFRYGQHRILYKTSILLAYHFEFEIDYTLQGIVHELV